jgi:hypothetical protein
MPTRKVLALALAIGGLFFGLAAAWYWRESTRVPIDPPGAEPQQMSLADPQGERMAWLTARLHANQETSRLNKTAARLTAVAVVLSTLSTVVGLAC